MSTIWFASYRRPLASVPLGRNAYCGLPAPGAAGRAPGGEAASPAGGKGAAVAAAQSAGSVAESAGISGFGSAPFS